MELKIKLLNDQAKLPVKENISDSGFDLFAAEDYIVEPGCTSIVGTGISIGLPRGFEGQIRPRSGITAKTKLRVQLGTIDESYRGELGIIVDNIGSDLFKINKGMKLAQLVIAPVAHPTIKIVDELNETKRGNNGFGSTGF